MKDIIYIAVLIVVLIVFLFALGGCAVNILKKCGLSYDCITSNDRKMVDVYDVSGNWLGDVKK